MNNLRVLHVTPTFWPEIGGIEAVIANLCLHTRTQGIHADVAHVAPGLRTGHEYYKGFSVYRVPLIGHPFIGLAPTLGRIAADYDLLHVHDPQLLSITASVRTFAGHIPAVLSTHGGFRHTSKFTSIKRVHERLLMSRMLQHYLCTLASSRSDLAYFSGFSDKVVLAENGVDVARFANILASTDRSPWNWIYWGRLSRNKRLQQVVEVVCKVRSLGYPVTLTIAGNDFDGSGKELKRYLGTDYEDFITLQGAVSDEKLEVLISRSGVFITASEYEGFGLTVIEAQAAGLIVICRDIEPLNNFVDRRNGLLLAFDMGADDMTKLNDFLARIVIEYPEMQARGRASSSQFAWPRAADRFIRTYRQALCIS